MSTVLQRTALLLLLWLCRGLLPASANHVMGGEMAYQFLDANGPADTPLRYSVTARVYYNSITAPYGGETFMHFTVTSRGAGTPVVTQRNVQRTSFEQSARLAATGCQVPQSLVLGVTITTYTTIMTLPAVSEGYNVALDIRARNGEITNITNPLGEVMVLSMDMTPGSLPNSSPTFTSRAVTLICMGETTFAVNNAYDADGDRLSYSLATPASPGPGGTVQYAPGYSAAQPFGASGTATIDANTGLARYVGTSQGQFLLAIDVKEYRTINGREILLGTTRRDVQVVVWACSGGLNLPPVFSAASLATRDFTVEEGQPLSFTVTATDPEAQLLTMNVSSVLLDGPGPIDATLNGQSGSGSSTVPMGTVTVTGVATVTGAFQLRAGCGLARPAPYDVLVTVTDVGCIGKTVAEIFRITVTQPPGPIRVVGDSVLCLGSNATYTAVGPNFGGYQWVVNGGEAIGPTAGRTVQVRWPAEGTGTVSVRGRLPNGCLSAPAFHAVAIAPGPAISGPALYCRTASTGLRYRVDGPAAAYQWSISDGTIVSGQGTNEVVVDIRPGAAASLQASSATGPLQCAAVLSIGLDNSCLAFYNIITPNADQQNDRFVIENIERHPNTALTIFNRWGRKIYQSADYQNTYDGEGTSAGVYYYLCQLADGTRYKGWFELVR